MDAHDGQRTTALRGPERVSETPDAAAPWTVSCDAGKALDPGDPRSASGFSRYEIQDELGRGGMGVVYRAFDRGPWPRADFIQTLFVLVQPERADVQSNIFRAEFVVTAGVRFVHPTPRRSLDLRDRKTAASRLRAAITSGAAQAIAAIASDTRRGGHSDLVLDIGRELADQSRIPSRVWRIIGKCALANGSYDIAEHAFRRAWTAFPVDAADLAGRALALRQLDREPEARAVLDHAFRMALADDSALWRLSGRLHRDDDFARLQVRWDRLANANIFPANDPLRCNDADTLARQGYATAWAQLVWMYDGGGTYQLEVAAQRSVSLGQSALLAGRRPEATAMARLAVRAAPHDPFAVSLLAAVQDDDVARDRILASEHAHWESQCREQPTSATVQVQWARFCATSGSRLDTGLEAARRAVELDPSSHDAHSALGEVPVARDELVAAERSLRQADELLEPDLEYAHASHMWRLVQTRDRLAGRR